MLDAESRDPSYRAQTQPGTTDHTGRIIPRGWLRAKQLDLSVANAGVELKVSGDFLFLDRNTSGIVTIRFNDPTEYGIPMGQFDMVEGVPIDRIWVSWAAQPGLVANIWYGYQARLKATAGVSDISDRAGRVLGVADVSDRAARLLGVVSGNGGALQQLGLSAAPANTALSINVRNLGFGFGASYASTVAMASNTSDTVFSAASNVNGAILWRATMWSHNATGQTAIAIAAAVAAPNSTIGGNVLAGVESLATAASSADMAAVVREPVFVPSGKGVFMTCNIAETIAHRTALYTLL